jgi:hypothetical protein
MYRLNPKGGRDMEDMIYERAIAIFGMLFWLAFPIGIMISVIQQDKDAHHGHTKDVGPGEESAYSHEEERSA